MQVPSPNWNPTPSKWHFVFGSFFAFIAISPIVYMIICPSDIDMGDVLAAGFFFLFIGGIASLGIIGGIRAVKRQNKYKRHNHKAKS